MAQILVVDDEIGIRELLSPPCRLLVHRLPVFLCYPDDLVKAGARVHFIARQLA